MAQASDIREHMEVVGSDGAHVGTVDHLDGSGRIKLARKDAPDGAHHHLPLSAVARVDSKVHLAMAATDALAMAGAAVTGVTGAPLTGTSAGTSLGADEALPPPIHNRAVAGAPARRNFVLPWIVAIVGIILLLLLLRSCMTNRAEAPAPEPTAAPAAPAAGEATAPLAVETVKLPNGTSVDLAPNTLNYALQRYLASTEPTPRTFTFDKLNFDTGSAAIRPEDQSNVDALAQILSAYPKAIVRIVGYTDARGSAPANAQLGAQRADAVVAALAAKGVERGRMTAASGGEANPADTNATPQGQFDNRRSELIVTAK